LIVKKVAIIGMPFHKQAFVGLSTLILSTV